MKSGLFVMGVAVHILFLCSCSSLCAQGVVRVEEDWELHVNEPDEQLDAPQITTAMLPMGPNSSTVFFLDINHGSAPDYTAGGLQLRAEINGESSASKRLKEGKKLSQQSEIIRWTLVMIRQNHQLKFGLVAGQGHTWNSFGGAESFVEVTAVPGTLDGYRPADSLGHSGAVYAGNRVASLKLVRVRLFDALGQMVEIPINQSPH
jgi:hypothetical protein